MAMVKLRERRAEKVNANERASRSVLSRKFYLEMDF